MKSFTIHYRNCLSSSHLPKQKSALLRSLPAFRKNNHRHTKKSHFSVAYPHRSHALPTAHLSQKLSFELNQSSIFQVSNRTQVKPPTSSACHSLPGPAAAAPVRDMCSLPKGKTEPQQNVKQWQLAHRSVCTVCFGYFGITGKYMNLLHNSTNATIF